MKMSILSKQLLEKSRCHFLAFLAFLCFAATPCLSSATQLTAEERLLDFQYLLSHIKSSYGPLHYKRRTKVADYDALVKSFETQIQQADTDFDYYYTVKRFVASFQDGHFGVQIPSSYRATLPFMGDLIEGRVLVDNVLPEAFNGRVGLQRGDEILAINGRPVADVMAELRGYTGWGSVKTADRFSAFLLSVRSARVIPVPKAPEVNLTVRLVGTQQVVDVSTVWTYTGAHPESISTSSDTSAAFTEGGLFMDSPATDNEVESRFFNLSLRSHLANAFDEQRVGLSFWCSPGTRIALPEGAQIIMQQPFLAYYYPTEKGNIGYLRIPHYSFGAPNIIENYKYAISILEENTVGLVIDQDHNCGGSVSQLGNIVSLFIDRPVENAMFQFVANKANYLEFSSYLNVLHPHTLFYAQLEDIVKKIEKGWRAGNFLSEKFSLQHIEPSHMRYTKPIIVLADEMAGSGGDAFPALMQGYGLAKILGSKTGGLGGSVAGIPPMPFSLLNVNMTRSLFYHPDGTAIENNGVDPDIAYTPTVEDFSNAYVNYRQFYTQKILELVK